MALLPMVGWLLLPARSAHRTVILDTTMEKIVYVALDMVCVLYVLDSNGGKQQAPREASQACPWKLERSICPAELVASVHRCAPDVATLYERCFKRCHFDA